MAGNWARAITIGIDDATESFACIQSTRDAAQYLLDQWTKERSPAYCAAIRMCAKAIKGEASHEGAYVAFMAAVREANLALVSNRMLGACDQFEIDIGQVLAESILRELRAKWAGGR